MQQIRNGCNGRWKLQIVSEDQTNMKLLLPVIFVGARILGRSSWKKKVLQVRHPILYSMKPNPERVCVCNPWNQREP